MHLAAYDPTRPISTYAIISVCAGILGWTVLPLVGTIAAIVYARAARIEILASAGLMQGEGLAKAGSRLGWTQVVVAVLVLLFAVPIMNAPVRIEIPANVTSSGAAPTTSPTHGSHP